MITHARLRTSTKDRNNRFFQDQAHKAAQLVPQARLLDKAGEIIEKSLQQCIQHVFVNAQQSVVGALRQLHDRVLQLAQQAQAEALAAHTPVCFLVTFLNLHIS
jgi:hypothetical protein